MVSENRRKKQKKQDSQPDVSAPRESLVTDAFLDLANEYIAGIDSGEIDTVNFRQKLDEAIKNYNITKVESCIKTLGGLSSCDPEGPPTWIVSYLEFLLEFCRVKGWCEAKNVCGEISYVIMFLSHVNEQRTKSSSAVMSDLIRMEHAEHKIMLEYGNFCLSQYLKLLSEPGNTNAYIALCDIEFKLSNLVEMSNGKEEFLSIYSKVLTKKLKKIDLVDWVKKCDQLIHGIKLYSDNSIIHLAHIKIEAFFASRPADESGDGLIKPEDAVKPGSSLNEPKTKSLSPGALTDLLANILLSEDLPSLYYCFGTILECLKRETEPEKMVGDCAEMFELLSMDASEESLKSLLSLASNLAYAFPDNESVITAYGWVQYQKMKYLKPSQKIPARIDFIKFISDHPQNEDLRKIFTSGNWNIRSKPGIGELVERKYEIDTWLSQFLEFDERLIDLYSNLLYDLASIQKTSDSVKTIGILEDFLEEHNKKPDIS